MKQQIDIRDFLDFSFLSNIQVGNNHAYAYIRHTSDKEQLKYKHQLYIGSKAFVNDDQASLFLLEEDSLLFASVRSEKDIERQKNHEIFTSFYRMSYHGGEGMKVFEIPYHVMSIRKYNEDYYLLFCECHKDDMEGDLLEKRKKRHQQKEDIEVLDEIPFYMNGDGYIDGRRNVIFLYHEKDQQLIRISSLDESVENVSMDLKNHCIYYSSEKINQKHDEDSSLYVYDVQQKQSTLLIDHGYSIYGLAKMSYGLLILGSDKKHYGLNENAQFYIYDGKEISLYIPYDVAIASSVGSDCRMGHSHSFYPCDDVLYFSATEYDHASIYALYPNQDIKCLYETNGSVDGLHVYGNDLYFVMMEANCLQEVYHMNLDDLKVTKCTSFNDDYMTHHDVVEVERCDFEHDGIKFQGWVMKPTNYDPSLTYPGILEIHGGPKTVYGNIYYHEMQVLANQGYFVFYTNPRGSDGRGNAFADIRGKYGTIDYDDLMAFVDHVLKQYPQIDAKRLGVCGGSYGGFMTNWIIGHTNRFQAAVSQRSIANWISFYNTSDIGEIFGDDQCNGNPWDDYEKLWHHSPLKYARNVSTPTLFIHADEDYRCPLSEGLQMYSALAMRKVDTRMVIFKHENHELSRSGAISRRIKRLEELVGWMNSHLKEEL